MNNRNTVVESILQHRAGAIIRTNDQQLAADAMQAAVDGGFRLIEFTWTTPGACELIASFAKKPGLLVGAGTVLTVQQARAAVDAGAGFLVSPVLDPKIIDEAHALGAAAIPGTFTATEMQNAHIAGADFVKLFPSPARLPEYISAICGPLPHLRIYPTHGVTLDNVLDVLKAGAAGVGFVRSLFEPDWMSARDFDAIRRRAQEIIARVARALS